MTEKEALNLLPYGLQYDEAKFKILDIENPDDKKKLTLVVKWQDTVFRLKYNEEYKQFSLYIKGDDLHEYNPIYWNDNYHSEQYNHCFYKQFFMRGLSRAQGRRSLNGVELIEKYNLLSHNPKRGTQLTFEDVFGVVVDIYHSRLGKFNRRKHRIHYPKGHYWQPNWKKVIEWKLLDDLPLYNLKHQPVLVEPEPEYESIDEKQLQKNANKIMSQLFGVKTNAEDDIDAAPEDGAVISKRRERAHRPKPEYIKNARTAERPSSASGVPYFFRNIPMSMLERVSKLKPKVWAKLNKRRLLTNPYIFPKGNDLIFSTDDNFVLNPKEVESKSWNAPPSQSYDYWNYVLWLANMSEKKWAKVEKYRLLQYRTYEMMRMLNLPDDVLGKIDAASQLCPRYAPLWEQTRIAPNKLMPFKSVAAKEADELFFESMDVSVAHDFAEKHRAGVTTALLVLEKNHITLPEELTAESLKQFYREFAKTNHPDIAVAPLGPQIWDSEKQSLDEFDKARREEIAAYETARKIAEKKFTDVSIALGTIRGVIGIVR